MHYHYITRVVSLLANANPKLNIVDRMSMLSSVNEYFLATENRINELEKQVKKLNNDLKKIAIQQIKSRNRMSRNITRKISR
jgi:predicted  nucleic acid-binding Zn-ribbon protein